MLFIRHIGDVVNIGVRAVKKGYLEVEKTAPVYSEAVLFIIIEIE